MNAVLNDEELEYAMNDVRLRLQSLPRACLPA